ncbi:MAG: hypothetical protein ACE5FS_04845 [Paracoccaceae bacterium]
MFKQDPACEPLTSETIPGLACIAEYDTIAGEDLRAVCEAPGGRNRAGNSSLTAGILRAWIRYSI